jgi:iron complex transport system substrate-binding protein
LIISPCGLEIERAQKEISVLERLPGWNDLKAVKYNEVYFADSNLFTCPSTKLVDGIELLASLFHPTLFDDLKHKHSASFKNISDKVIA